MARLRPRRLGLARGHLLLVVTGALAARSAPDLVEAVRAWYPDVTVRVLVTEAAQRFVTPTLLRVASRQPVVGPGWTDGHDHAVPHRELAAWADVVLVYPASGNTTAKLAAGIGDCLALATVQDAECPVVLAPGPSPGFAGRRIHQDNVRRLRESGYLVLDPVPGRAASDGTVGPFTPPPPEDLLMAIAGAVLVADPV
ncbi:flavoprotein [Micrococcus endophyticus]|uniref:Phosphopantothenoylcysteine decarboxylase/phosphopantothenate--cysteine ligase n=1 Tax=Micrococcus endophyticus TaxID=455343 RepID=A0A7W9N0V3_9MICC|nr:flavoprotein [Micrococcus endophyticus]MBB5849163.1 phosphopantothenoylcysteine decarboxylase/phosphopantothenate--cysteine ligase [Micrococcus endophyticus]